jgi:hypothetical protein
MRIVEHLNKGVVQTRDPGVMKPGELQNADNTVLRPADPAIHRTFGRTVYGTVASTNVADCSTDTSTILTTTNTFASSITVTGLERDATRIASAEQFGSVTVGQSVWGTGIPTGARVRRVISTSKIEIDRVITAPGATTILVGDIHENTYIAGTPITTGTKVVTVDTTTTLTMSATAPLDSSFTAAFGEKLDGLKYLTFDSGQRDLLLAKADHKLYYSELTGTTGTFTELEAGMSSNDEAGLETINTESRYAVLTGYDTPRVVYYKDDESASQVITDRALGMLAVSAAAFIGPNIDGTGAWPEDAFFGAGDYFFLITEVMKIDDGQEVEGTYEGDTKSVTITDPTSEGIRVTYTGAGGLPINDGLYGRNLATHWRIYMSKRADEETEVPALGTFRMITDVGINTSSIILGKDNVYRAGYPDGISTPAGYSAMFPDGTTNVVSGQATHTVPGCSFTDGANTIDSSGGFGNVEPGMYVFSPDNDLPQGCRVLWKTVGGNSEIHITPPTAAANDSVTLTFGNENIIDHQYDTAPNNPDANDYRAVFFHSFGLGSTIGNFSGASISGVKVEIIGILDTDARLPDPGFQVSVFQGGIGGTESVIKTNKFGIHNENRQTLSFGGPTDDWNMATLGTAWASTDFADGAGNFGVKIRKNAVPAFYDDDIFFDHRIDGIRVTVYAGTPEITLNGDPFPVITISDQLGVATDIPANGPPPIASTGDVFDGIMILNDTKDESVIAGSSILNYEAYPSVYRIPIQSKDNDKITVIRRLGKICIIGMENSIKRLNYFPQDTDADFNRGRAYEDVATDHGMVGPQAATLLDLPGRGTVLAYLSNRGLYWTDGITSIPLNTDIDWENLFDNTKIQRATLVVYPKLYLLALYYWASGAAYKAKALYFSYHPTHIKEGGELPACGPNDVRGESACSPFISGTNYLFTGHSLDGKVYREDDGSTTDENASAPDMTIRTRRIYQGGFGDQGRLNNVHLLVSQQGPAGPGAFNANLYYQEEGKAVTANTENPYVENTAVGGIINLWHEVFGDAFDFEITKDNTTSAAFRLHLIGFETTDYKLSTSN